MRNLILISVLILSMIPMVSSQAVPDSAAIDITLLNQDPDPAYPGSLVEVRFLVENLGTKKMEDVMFEIIPDRPFTLEPGDDGKRYAKTLYSRQVGEDAYVFYYRLSVADATSAGTYDIRMQYSRDDGDHWIKTDPFKVRVDTREPIVAIQEVSTEPAQVPPGEQIDMTIEIQNMAGIFVNDLQVNLGLTPNAETGQAIPFSPVGSSNEKVIETLRANEMREISFSLVADPDAQPGVYKIPISMMYKDENAASYQREGVITVVVGETPEMLITRPDSNSFIVDEQAELSIEFTNRGLTDMKLVTVTLNASDAVELESAQTVYVGNIDSDDYESADFQIIPKESGKEITIPMHIEFLDANNKRYTKDAMITIPVYSQEDALSKGLIQRQNYLGYIITALIVMGGFFLYRRRKKKRQ